jgi:hypothetical protein
LKGFNRSVEILNFTLEAPLNKKLSGRAKGVDACRNFSRTFQKAVTPAQILFGRRKCCAGLQELFADIAKGMYRAEFFGRGKSILSAALFR